MENTKLLKGGYMKSLCAFLFIFGLMITSGCSYYPGISGKVVDSATGKPIEGVIVVAQWTKFCGWLGEQQRDLHKIVETLTDKEGKFSLGGTMGFVLDPPEMIIYKEGYIPWRNDSTFPDKDSDNHEWKNNVTYKLDVFTDKYTASQLSDFLQSGMILGMGRKESTIFTNVANKISDKKENELRIQKIKDKKP